MYFTENFTNVCTLFVPGKMDVTTLSSLKV